MASSHTLSVPVVNEENICLPLVVSAVSKYWGMDLPLAEAKEIAKKYPGIKGSIMIEGVELAERHGLSSLILNSSLKELRKMIDIGIPPIVIMPGIRDVVQHAALIIGYDEIEKTIFHYIPEPDKIGAIPEKKFDEQWVEDDRLMLLLVPSDILSDINLRSDNKEKSNRLCFNAERLRLQGRHDEAILLLKKALEINKSNSTASCLIAGILNDKNSPDAIKYYQMSTNMNHRCYLAYRGLGNYFLKTRDYAKAEEYYTAAIEVNPKRFAPIYKNRGLVRLEQKKVILAKEDFKKYLEEMPEALDKEGIIKTLDEL